jgi:hypothetical protein
VNETPSGLPDEAGEQDEVTPLGVPADEDDEREHDELPGLPEGEPDTAG